MREQGITIKDIAQSFGISTNTVTKYQKGSNDMSMTPNSEIRIPPASPHNAQTNDVTTAPPPTPAPQASTITLEDVYTEIQAVKQGMRAFMNNQQKIIAKLQELEYANQERTAIQQEQQAQAPQPIQPQPINNGYPPVNPNMPTNMPQTPTATTYNYPQTQQPDDFDDTPWE